MSEKFISRGSKRNFNSNSNRNREYFMKRNPQSKAKAENKNIEKGKKNPSLK